MALLDSELARIKAELGYNVLTVGAEPWINTAFIFSQVVQDNVLAGAVTTSSTTVTADSSPTQATLTLADATGFTAGDVVVVDVDSLQESGTVQSVSGSDITLLLQNAHSGTYPVTVEGGESIVRETLRRISDVKDSLSKNYGAGSLKKVDEIEFYGTGGDTYFSTLAGNLAYWRDELASQLGVANMWRCKQACAQRLSVY